MTDSSNGGIDRRQSFRLDMEKEIIDISWIDENNQERVKKIACLDFARGGLKIDFDEPLPLGIKVDVIFRSTETKSKILPAKVLRCIKQDNGWYEVALLLDKDA